MTPEEFQALVNAGGTDETPSLTAVAGPDLQPGTARPKVAMPASIPAGQSRFVDTPEQYGLKPVQRMQQAYIDENQEKGVPLDVQSGLPAAKRIALSFQPTTKDQLAYLKKAYGADNVRLSTDGMPIVRMPDPATGKFKDVRAENIGLSPKNLLELPGQVLPAVAGMAATSLWPIKAAPSVLSRVADIGRMAVATEASGAAQDAATRALSGQPVDAGEIAARRGGAVPGDVAMGAAGAVAGKVASKTISPGLGVADTLAKQGQEAAKAFESQGFNLPQTLGERSGWPILQRTEAILGKYPGSSAAIKAIRDKQDAELARIQKAAMGLNPDATAADIAALPTQEQTGAKATEAIAGKVGALKSDVQGSAQELGETGQSELKKTLNQAAPGGPINATQLGGELRESAIVKRDAFQAASAKDYAKVYEHPLAQTYQISGDELAADAKKLLAQMPRPELKTPTKGVILDQYQHPILQDKTSRDIARNFVPPAVLAKLDDLSKMGGGKLRLGDLLKMRTDVSADIARGEAVGDQENHWLNEIRKMLDTRIKSGLAQMPDQSLNKLWQTANANYARDIHPFKKSGIQELFKESGQPGFVGDSEVVNRAMSGSGGVDTFNAYKQFYGSTSKEFGNLKRAVLERVTGASSEPFSDTIDAGVFIKNLGKLYQNAPDVAKEVFGAKSGQLMQIAKAIDAGDTGESVLGGVWQNRLQGKIDPGEFQKMLASGEPTAQKLANLINKEKNLADAYKNDLVNKIGTGKFDTEKLDPSKFVRYFSTQAEPADVRHVMSLINDRPDVLQEIKTKTVQDILDRAYPESKAMDNPALLSGEPRALTATGIQDALGDNTQRERYRAIIGDETYKDLENLTKFLAPRERADKTFAAAGGLGAGQQIAGWLRTSDLRYLYNAGKHWLIATIYTNPQVRKWAENQAITPENSAKSLRYLISSTPVVEAAFRDFGAKGAEDFMAQVNSSINRNQQDQTQEQSADQAGRQKRFQDLLNAP